MGRTLLALAACALLAPGVAADDPKLLTWMPSLADAIVAAKEKNLPVLIAVVAGDEKDRVEFLAAYKESGLAPLADKVITVVAAEGLHASSETDACPQFPGVTCGQHMANFAEVSKKFCMGERQVPQHIFLDAKGKMLFKRGFGFTGSDGSELARRINVALALTGKDLEDRPLAEKERFRLEVLLPRLRDPDVEARKAAAEVAGNTDNREILAAVSHAVRTTNDEAARGSIYEALGKRGNWSAIEILKGGFGDKEITVRAEAILAMEKVDMPDAGLLLLAHSTKDGSLTPAAYALKSACYVDTPNPKIQAAALANATHNRVSLRIGAAWGLSRMLGNEKATVAMRQGLGRDKEVNGRAAAAWSLGCLGEKSDAVLIQTQLGKEAPTPEFPREVMQAAIDRLNGSVRGDYEELIGRLLLTEGVEDLQNGKGNWGKWGKWGGGGKGGGMGGGGWGGKGGGGWGKGGGGKGKG